MNESQLVRAIKAHVEKGDKATDKAEQHYISAGQHLKTLKAKHDSDGGNWAGWTALLRTRVVSVELDAIEPDLLRALVKEAIEEHLSPKQFEILKAAEQSEREIISKLVGRLAP